MWRGELMRTDVPLRNIASQLVAFRVGTQSKDCKSANSLGIAVVP